MDGLRLALRPLLNTLGIRRFHRAGEQMCSRNFEQGIQFKMRQPTVQRDAWDPRSHTAVNKGWLLQRAS